MTHKSISYSENGWTDAELALLWMVCDFDQQTCDKANGNVHILLLDGHSSHYSLELLKYACAHNIIILGYPPHCTHALQGLDVVCFAKMKEAWKTEIKAFKSLHLQAVKKADFTGVFGNAFLKAFTKPLVESAFSATGIHPFDHDIITPQQTMASEATSTTAGFGVQQPSPVHAILHAWQTAQTPISSSDQSHALPVATVTHMLVSPLLPTAPASSNIDSTLQFGMAALWETFLSHVATGPLQMRSHLLS